MIKELPGCEDPITINIEPQAVACLQKCVSIFINEVIPAIAEAAATVIRMALEIINERLIEIGCEYLTQRQIHLMYYSKKYRTRKKYQNMAIKRVKERINFVSQNS